MMRVMTKNTFLYEFRQFKKFDSVSVNIYFDTGDDKDVIGTKMSG
jgi:hypothetical protein